MLETAEAIGDSVLPSVTDDHDQIVAQFYAAAGTAADRLGRVIRSRRETVDPDCTLDPPWDDMLEPAEDSASLILRVRYAESVISFNGCGTPSALLGHDPEL
ncbi:MAG TPA: hypothetical protein VM493_10720 [Vicinamibacterales bacterium]|nr:hypothetical protein [Vicinamibacterales bacterium]